MPSSSSNCPRRLRVSFWRPSALSTCSSVTRPISLRMSPRRSLLVRWLRTMSSRRSSAVIPRASGSRSADEAADVAVAAASDSRSPADTSWAGAQEPPFDSKASLRRSSTTSDAVACAVSMSSTGSMIGSSSSPPRPVRTARCLPGLLVISSMASRITSSGAGRPVQRLNASAACRSSIVRPSTTVAPRACAATRKSVGAEAYTASNTTCPAVTLSASRAGTLPSPAIPSEVALTTTRWRWTSRSVRRTTATTCIGRRGPPPR